MQYCDKIVEDGQHLDKLLRKDPQNLEEINDYACKLREKYYSTGQMSLKKIAAELDFIEWEIVKLQNNRSSTTGELENKLLILDQYLNSIQFLYEVLKQVQVPAPIIIQDEDEEEIINNYEEQSSISDEQGDVTVATEITEGVEVVDTKRSDKVKVGSHYSRRRSTTILMDIEMTLFKQQHEEKQLLQYLEKKNLKLTASGNIIKPSGKKYDFGRSEQKRLVTFKRNNDGVRIAEKRAHEGQTTEENGLSLQQGAAHVSMDSLSKLFKRDLNKDPEEIAIMLLKRKLASQGVFILSTGEMCLQSGKILNLEYIRNLGVFTENELNLLTTLVISPGKTESYESSISEESMISLPEHFDDDSEYLKATVGKPLTLALAEICLKKPRDPIHYLGHWLYKYRYNQEVNKQKQKEILELQALVNKRRQESMMENAVGYLKIR